MRQFQFRVGYENFALIHVSLVPDMHGEQKTKPTQTTVHALRGLGLLPDLVGQSPLLLSSALSLSATIALLFLFSFFPFLILLLRSHSVTTHHILMKRFPLPGL